MYPFGQPLIILIKHLMPLYKAVHLYDSYLCLELDFHSQKEETVDSLHHPIHQYGCADTVTGIAFTTVDELLSYLKEHHM